MSDDRMRALARRFQETGALEDQAALLLAQVRAGLLPRTRLELAAHCGHAGAGAAIGVGTDGWLLEQGTGFRSWGARLIELGGREAAVRALLGAGEAWAGQPVRVELDPTARDLLGRAETALRAVEVWLLDPNPRTRKRAARLGGSNVESGTSWLQSGPSNAIARVVYRLALRTVGVLATRSEGEVLMHLAAGLGWIRWEARLGLPEGRVWEALRGEVAAWALGADPVSLRVRARVTEA